MDRPPRWEQRLSAKQWTLSLQLTSHIWPNQCVPNCSAILLTTFCFKGLWVICENKSSFQKWKFALGKFLKKCPTDPENFSGSKVIALLLECVLSSRKICLLKRHFWRARLPKTTNQNNYHPSDIILPLPSVGHGDFCEILYSYDFLEKGQALGSDKSRKVHCVPSEVALMKAKHRHSPGRVCEKLNDQFHLRLRSHFFSVVQLITKHLQAECNEKRRISANVFFSKPAFIYSFSKYIPNTYFEPGTVLSARDIALKKTNKQKNPSNFMLASSGRDIW